MPLYKVSFPEEALAGIIEADSEQEAIARALIDSVWANCPILPATRGITEPLAEELPEDQVLALRGAPRLPGF